MVNRTARPLCAYLPAPGDRALFRWLYQRGGREQILLSIYYVPGNGLNALPSNLTEAHVAKELAGRVGLDLSLDLGTLPSSVANISFELATVIQKLVTIGSLDTQG